MRRDTAVVEGRYVEPGGHAPCQAATAPQRTITQSLPAGDDAEFRSAKGAWRGPAQFQFSVSGARAADAHAIGRRVIDLQPDGRVRGVIDEAGCKLSGLHMQFVSAACASIDFTVSGCGRCAATISSTISA